jgi:hypothetical protein
MRGGVRGIEVCGVAESFERSTQWFITAPVPVAQTEQIEVVRPRIGSGSAGRP